MFEFFKNLFGSSAEVEKALAEGAVIVDVRTKQEYNSGHIKGSRNIPLNTIKQQAGTLMKLNKPIITVCQSGSRSAMAKSILKSSGLQAYNGGSWMSLRNKIQ